MVREGLCKAVFEPRNLRKKGIERKRTTGVKAQEGKKAFGVIGNRL